jgi:hypothetical protein
MRSPGQTACHGTDCGLLVEQQPCGCPVVPLLRYFFSKRAPGEVHPIVFGAYGRGGQCSRDGGSHRQVGRCMDGRHRSVISISRTTCSPRKASQRASCARKSERPASTRTHTSSFGRTRFCQQPGYGAAYGTTVLLYITYGRRRDHHERFNRARAQEQEARGTGRHRAFGGIPPRRWSF